jgi:HK97 gp10 family phage protein
MSKVIPNSVAVAQVAISAGLEQVKTLVNVMSKIASKNSPHDTGNNSDSIAKDAGMEGGKIVGRVYTQSGYGGWLEIGTSKMPARPYIAPAYQEAKDLTR